MPQGPWRAEGPAARIVRGGRAGQGRNTLIPINIRSTITAVLLALLAVTGLSGVAAASGPAGTNWGSAAMGEVEQRADVHVVSAGSLIQPPDSDWG
ncbi:hypothetical protein GCM10017750_01660 [Streptomyces racemochromogenes]